MFDNLKDLDLDDFLEDQEAEKPPKTPQKIKKILRLHSPIYKYVSEDPLQERLAEFIIWGNLQQGINIDNPHKTVYLVRAFVRDSDNSEYSIRIPKYLVNLIRNAQLIQNE